MSISATQPIHPEEECLRAPQPVPRAILTPKGERAMRANLDRLRQGLEGEFSERLREARGFGGSRENDDYLQIKEEEAVLTSRIRRLEGLLESADIVDEDAGAPDGVAVGSLVEVKGLESGEVRQHRLTGWFGPGKPGEISASSPVGQALLGRAPGECVTAELPSGRSIEFEILRVESDAPTAQPDRA
jgi:transcription elongation factor GreA